MAINKVVYAGNTLIDISGDTIKPENLDEGVTAHDKSGNLITGTSTKDSDTSDATAADTEILAGKTAYVNGVKITGTMTEVEQATPSISVSSGGLITASATQTEGYVNAGTKSETHQLPARGTTTITPGTSNKTISAGYYLTGTQTIKGDANLVPKNIASGVSIFGVLGTLTSSTSVDNDISVGSDLPDGISKLSSGTYTSTSDITSNVTIAHGLGVIPNFYMIVLETDVSSSPIASTLVCGAGIYKRTKTSSSGTAVYTVSGLHVGFNSSKTRVSGAYSQITNTAFTSTTNFKITLGNEQALKAGHTYRWICGVLDGIE